MAGNGRCVTLYQLQIPSDPCCLRFKPAHSPAPVTHLDKLSGPRLVQSREVTSNRDAQRCRGLRSVPLRFSIGQTTRTWASDMALWLTKIDDCSLFSAAAGCTLQQRPGVHHGFAFRWAGVQTAVSPPHSPGTPRPFRIRNFAKCPLPEELSPSYAERFAALVCLTDKRRPNQGAV